MKRMKRVKGHEEVLMKCQSFDLTSMGEIGRLERRPKEDQRTDRVLNNEQEPASAPILIIFFIL